MTPETFNQLAPALARTILDEHVGFLTSETLPELAKAWPDARVLVRCHAFRFIVTADQAADAIAHQGDQLRDASLLAGFWTAAVEARARGAEMPVTLPLAIVREAERHDRWATDATSGHVSELHRMTAATLRSMSATRLVD